MASKMTPDEAAVTAIRMMAIDMVDKAKSGHPGAPMGMAPMAHILFSRHLVVDPSDPHWINRDRVILSNGHASALLYALLHLSGYDLSIDELKKFRQLGSKTPGHPESFKTPGVEVTTGPLGQGFANAVGSAIAQTHLSATYNRPQADLITNKTYVFCGDGCLQEGVTSEAASLAGHLRLHNLIVLYDDNKITIDGCTDNSFTEDVEGRFRAYGWDVLTVLNGDMDLEGIDKAISLARISTKPTLIRIRTTIGYGSKVQGTHGVHGSPLLADDIEELKIRLGVDPKANFVVPEEVGQHYRDTVFKRGSEAHNQWNAVLAHYWDRFPKEHEQFTRRISGLLPEGWEKSLPSYDVDSGVAGGRKYSEHVLNALSERFPDLIGGSADLTSSNYTRVKNAEDFQHPETGLGSYTGNYIRYGVREHAMGAIMNGISAYGGFIPFAGTFLNFVSYAAGALRLSALSQHRVIWVATHDSIGLGEDGPTHQPVETVAWLRAMPNLNVWRPADGNETSAAYLVALQEKSTPTVLCLSRQNLPHLAASSIEKASRGGYVVLERENSDITLIATGSEVAIAVEAAHELVHRSIKARVVSLPCWEAFERQTPEYREMILQGKRPTLSIEAYSSFGWAKYSQDHAGLDAWGDSAPPSVLYEHFGLTPKGVASRAERLLSKPLH